MVQITGGDKLSAALAEIAQNASKAAEVDVGFLEGSTYPDGTSVPMVAAIQEFGSPANNIPPRPFFRSMIQEKSPEWPGAVAGLLKANDFDAEQTLAQTGAQIKYQLQQSIEDFVGVPLKPETIKRKGFDKQLVDTGHMRNSIKFNVKS